MVQVGGLCQLTKAMAKSWSKFGINVNMVSPGFFETDLTKQISNTEEWVRCAQKTAICRNGLLKDIYGIVIFLSSEASNYILLKIFLLMVVLMQWVKN